MIEIEEEAGEPLYLHLGEAEALLSATFMP